MAKLRKFCAYRRLERPYTRISKYRAKSYVRTRPNSKVVGFEMGNPKGTFECTLNLISKEAIQIRHNAIEAARQSSNKILERNLGKDNYHLKIRVYPHHILRENPLASGAGADRMSTGMRMSFGKPIGVAAQVKPGQKVIEIHVNKADVAVAKQALKRFTHKFSGTYSIEVNMPKAG